MIISNLSYLESMSEKGMVQGGGWRGHVRHRGPGFGGFDFDLAVNVAAINQIQVGGIGNGQFAVIGQNADA